MTVREPIPDLTKAVPVEAPGIEALVPAAGRRVRSPLFAVSVLLYATTLLLLLAFPRSVSAWLDDMTPNPVIKVLRVGTGALEHAADKIGVSSASDAVRQTFLKQIQRD
jgi:hypothetical protein